MTRPGFKQYSNLHAWVGKLDEAVEAKLAIRLQAGIEAWTKALDGKSGSGGDDDLMDTTVKEGAEGQGGAHKLGGEPQIKKMLHDIRSDH